MTRKLLSIVALSIVPVIYAYYFVEDIGLHQTSPKVMAEFTWIIPYAAAAIEWVRLGNRLSLVSRLLIIGTNVLMALFLFATSA